MLYDMALLNAGVFIFHADSSLVLATHPTIASEFNALDSSSWLFTAFALAGAATQNTVCFPLVTRFASFYGVGGSRIGAIGC